VGFPFKEIPKNNWKRMNRGGLKQNKGKREEINQ
jgi:hypothetical protein